MAMEGELIPINRQLVTEAVRPRPTACHKGTCGRVLVIAGSRGLTGAAVMAAQAAMRAGAGIVTLACAASLNTIFEIKLTEPMTIPVADNGRGFMGRDALNTLMDKARGYDVVLIGPGLGRQDSTMELVREFVTGTECQLIIDADGLYAFNGQGSLLKQCKRRPILTPHVGELAGLLGVTVDDLKGDYMEIICRESRECNCIIVGKSEKTVVVYPDGSGYVTTVGNPGMATAGSGDVLAGTIAGICPQVRADRSPVVGVYIHGRAGDLAYAEYGNGLIATDMIDRIGRVLLELK